MNLLGKILVVLVTLMSIAFLGVATAVFATHKNWSATMTNQNTQITQLRQDLETLETDYKRLESNLELEIDTAQQQVIKLENERAALANRNAAAQAQIDDLRQQRRDLTTAVASTQAKNKQLAETNAQLQQDIAGTMQATNAAFDETVRATSQLHEAKMMLETELERNAQLVEQAGGN
ncbi:hypothetical protein NG895_24070 [Aeoliella sp. ICT_H6.2]|uniref:Uncharacterized protein n=2 Tax=Aeoliella straminimaris TaxID=2954799 RepID=A0A9X2FEZ5_9BACT|nr:hypothetical protein [Aeoliella straminimaris]